MTFPLEDAKTALNYNGHTVDKITLAILIEAADELGYPVSMLQGGNRPTTSYSATTHRLLGVGDLPANDHERKIKVFSDLGCYIYHRLYLPGVWGEHLHFGVIDHPWRDPMLVAQQNDWLHHPPLNALSGHAQLTGQYHPGKKIVFDYDPNTERRVVPMTKVEEARDKLVTAISNIADAAAFLDDADKSRVVARAQIDDLKREHKDLRVILSKLPNK